MTPRRFVALVGTITIVAAVAAAWPAPSGAATAAVDIQDSQFVAATITVTAGDTVTWTESGQGGHSVTADDASFDSSPSCPGVCLGNGSVFSHTFASPGVYRYYCRVHGAPNGQGMSGTVTVLAAETTTTTAPTTTTADPATTATTAAPMAAANPTTAVSATAALTG